MENICKDCITWKQQKENCPVYWKGKKQCSLKVISVAELTEQQLVLKK